MPANHWPSGIRDTTEFPSFTISIDEHLRDHLRAFLRMDHIGWNDYDAQAQIYGTDVGAQRFRTYRKIYEMLGLIYPQDGLIRLTTLGIAIAGTRDRLEAMRGEIMRRIAVSAVDVLARYQLKNPVDD